MIPSLLEKIFTQKTLLLLSIIFIFALGIRLIYFNNALTFGYDQARDMFQAREIWTKDPVKIIGPQSDTPGLHHGSFYWYLISPFAFLSGGDVWVTRFFLIIVNCLTIFFIYDLTKSLFKDKRIALLASFIFAISFEATQYARWLSNPSPAILTSTISFWSLKKLIEGKGWAFITLLFSWGLSVQLQLFMLYQIVVFPLIWFLTKGLTLPKISLKNIFLAKMALLLSIASFIVGEILFKMQNTLALWNLLQSHTSINASFSSILTTFLDRLVNVFYTNVWGINLVIAGIACIIILTKSLQLISNNQYRNEFLLLILWVISPIILHFFSGTNSNYITLGAGVGVAILTSYFLFLLFNSSKFKWLGFLALLIIIIGNMNLILKINKTGESLFSVQYQVNLADELAIADWVYQEAHGKPFYLNTITNPSFINTTWAYIFDWYGKKKYGYMPIWWGETQVGVYGSEVNFSEDETADLHFLIVEPTTGRDDITEAIKYLEDSRSQVIQTKKIGNFTVEKRQITTKRIFTNQDVFYYMLNKGKF